MPDTQTYQGFPAIFQSMTSWIAANIDSRKIELVLHEGDIVQDNIPGQWQIAKDAFGTLNGQVPYILAAGNHDLGPNGNASNRNTLLNTYFQLSDNPLNNSANGIFTTQYIAGRMENTYATLSAPDGRQLLVFALEFAPRQQVVDWANSVAALPQFQDATAVLLTHAYLEEGPAANGEPTAVRSNWALYGPSRQYNPHSYPLANINPITDPVHDGEELWDELVSQHASFEMVLNGHYLDDTDTNPNGRMTTARQTVVGVNGNAVHEIVFNSQEQPNGGNGYLRLMEFLNDGKTVQVRTYSPSLDLWLVDTRNQFQIELSEVNPPLLGDFNGDGIYDCEDIDELVQMVATGSVETRFDLTLDGVVNRLDVDKWLQTAGAVNLGPERSFLKGDATLDGHVDGEDFIRWNQFKFTNTAAWCSGDFDSNGVIDGQDFIAWNQNKFQSSGANLIAQPPTTPNSNASSMGVSGTSSQIVASVRSMARLGPTLQRIGNPFSKENVSAKTVNQTQLNAFALSVPAKRDRAACRMSPHRVVPESLSVDLVMSEYGNGCTMRRLTDVSSSCDWLKFTTRISAVFVWLLDFSTSNPSR